MSKIFVNKAKNLFIAREFRSSRCDHLLYYRKDTEHLYHAFVYSLHIAKELHIK